MIRHDAETASIADSFTGSFSIPGASHDWEILAQRAKLLRKRLHDFTKFGSGSKILKEQFVLFRALLPRTQLPIQLISPAQLSVYRLESALQRA